MGVTEYYAAITGIFYMRVYPSSSKVRQENLFYFSSQFLSEISVYILKFQSCVDTTKIIKEYIPSFTMILTMFLLLDEEICYSKELETIKLHCQMTTLDISSDLFLVCIQEGTET